MLELGVFQQSLSNWASPLHMMPQKTAGDWCPCGDYCTLKNVSILDRYTILHIQGFTFPLHGTTIVSKLDLVQAYKQIPMELSDVPKTVIITALGLYYEFV